MTDIIGLNERRNGKEQPDPGCTKLDEYGRQLCRFAYEFDHSDGKSYGFDFWAYDIADAEAKMASIRQNGRIIGQIFGEVPA